jgi:chemotaxis protein methyltransferase CheR
MIRDDVQETAGMSSASFARLAAYITSELGIKMPETKLTMVQSRLLRRVRDLQLTSIDQYTEYFFDAGNAHEREQLINAITTNKTDFFREPQHFEYLVGTVLPGLANRGRGSGQAVKVWSAGCSSGEEAYTLAMILDAYAAGMPGFDFAILATDVSTQVLQRGHRGIYSESHVQPVPAGLRSSYLLQSRDGAERMVRVVPGLRAKVSFHQLNFMDDAYRIGNLFQVVFFRNVMIYFDRPTQEAVINKICRHLAPGGYLFAGHSESLAGLDIPLRPVKASIYRKVS